MKLLTTSEVAERLGVHRSRVNVLIKAERLPAQRFGRAYMIKESDLHLVAERQAGRPPKNAAAKTHGTQRRTAHKLNP